MVVLYFCLSAIFLLATILSAKRWRVWWVKGFNGISFYLLIGMVILLLAGFSIINTGNNSLLFIQSLLITGIFYQFLKVLPFTLLFKKEVKDSVKSKGIRFLSANVRMSNRFYKQMLELIEKYRPDAVLLTEVDEKWIAGIDILKATYPHCLERPQDNTYGMALYSKLPFGQTEIRYLVEEDVPSFHVELHHSDKQCIQFIGLHPKPPAPWTRPENKDMELIKAAAMTNWNRLPSIVTGDLNDVGWSQVTQEFKSISDLLDPRIGRGFFNTYSALVPFFRMPIDHFFVSHHFRLVEMKRLEKFGSDHFPVMLEVELVINEKAKFTKNISPILKC